MTFTVDKIAKMQRRVEFIIGFRNIVNLMIVFFAAIYLTLRGTTTEGFIVGVILFITGVTRLYDQVINNIDDLTIQDIQEKNDEKDG